MMQVVLFLLIPVVIWAKPEITWAVNDAAPYYIDKGELRGQGFGDLTQQAVMEKMRDYEHRVIRQPLSRVIKAFEHGKEVCFSTWIYASTPEIAITSIPNIYYPPPGIIINKKERERFGQPPVFLKKIMQESRLTFGQAKGRGYGEPLDAIVESHRGEEHFKIRSASEDPTEGVLAMIERGRIDYTIDYPHALAYYEQMIPHQEQLVYLPLQETSESGVEGAIACSRSEWGKRTIRDINQAILKVRSTPAYKKILERWVVPEGDSASYWSEYQAQVLDITE